MTYTPNLPHWYDRSLRRSETASDNVTMFVKMLESLRRSGLDPSPFPEFEQVHEIAATATATAEAFSAARDVTATVGDLAAQVAAGKLDPAKAMTKAAALETFSAGNGSANDLARITQNHYTAEARRLMRQPGDRWITEMFRPKVDALASQLPELVAALPAHIVTNLDNAAENNRRIREAWGRIADIGRELGDIYGEADRMREAGMIPIRNGSWAGDFRYLDKTPLAGLPSEGARTMTLLVVGVRRGAVPGIFTQAEIDNFVPPQPADHQLAKAA